MKLSRDQINHLRSLIRAEIEHVLMEKEGASPEVLYDQEEMNDQSWDQFADEVS